MRDKADPLLSPDSQSAKVTGFRNKARDGKLFWRGIKRQLTVALSAPAEPRKGGGGLEVKQRRYIMIKGSWKREEQKAKVRKRMRAKALAAFPSCSTRAAQSYTTTTTTIGYLDEGLHIAVKQLMVIRGARPRLPHFLWFRGKGGGPGNKNTILEIEKRGMKIKKSSVWVK